MARSDSSRLQAYYMPEVSWGVIPATALTAMRVTGVDFGGTKETTESEELREDRQTSDVPEVGAGGAVTLPFEWSHGTFDELLAGLCFNAWSGAVTVTGSTNIDFAAAGKTITQSGASFNTQFKVGQILRIKATTSNGTNSVPKFVTVTALSATVITCAGDTFVDETGTSAVIHTGGMLRNWVGSTAGGGYVEKSYVLEVKAPDLSNIFHYNTGAEVNQFDLNLAARQKITGSIAFLTKDWTPSATTSGTGAVTAANTNPIVNATSNVARLVEGGTDLATAVKSIRLSMVNNLREQAAIGSKYAIGIGHGTFGITGQIEPYFEDNALANKFKNHTPTSLRVDLQDSLAQRTILSIPRLVYSGGRVGPQAQGRNQDTGLPLPIQAYMDPTTLCTVQFDRFV